MDDYTKAGIPWEGSCTDKKRIIFFNRLREGHIPEKIK